MIVKREQLLNYLEKRGLSAATLARTIGVKEIEVDKLLRGEAVNEATARCFIYYVGADEAVKMIDWTAIGKKNPLADNN